VIFPRAWAIWLPCHTKLPTFDVIGIGAAGSTAKLADLATEHHSGQVRIHITVVLEHVDLSFHLAVALTLGAVGKRPAVSNTGTSTFGLLHHYRCSHAGVQTLDVTVTQNVTNFMVHQVDAVFLD
jgi:hypothetical protein